MASVTPIVSDPRIGVIDMLSEEITNISETESVKAAILITVHEGGFVYAAYSDIHASEVVTACEIVKARNIAALDEYQEEQ